MNPKTLPRRAVQRRHRRWWHVAVLTLVAATAPRWQTVDADEIPAVAVADEDDSSTEDSGVYLPADRSKDRLLDRARRLLAAGQWADAVSILDELLAAESDSFSASSTRGGTRRSVKVEATRLVESLPPPARDAYSLLYRGRAERALDDAVAREDDRAVVGIARRWFMTPAGRRACAMAAHQAAERGDAAAAMAWIGRLSLPSVEAEACRARVARVAAADEGGTGWLQPRGAGDRNAVAEASRPLLVPRYRIPLIRHPEESRLLEARRRAAVADGHLAIPAGLPLAVGDTLVVPTPLGILGVDFASGKRLWMQSAVPAASDAEATLSRGFDDATSGGVSSDGRHAFAVESHADALTPRPDTLTLGRIGRDAGGWHAGNCLSAYDTQASGRLAWRLPVAARGGVGHDADVAADWFLGSPLVVGDELFVLVECRGQVRLDVLDAATGSTRWSQPLADIEQTQSVSNADAYARRLAGLTPASAEGIVVCPLGGGTVVALDAATRTLLWAHAYRVAGPEGEDLGPAGARLRAIAIESREPAAARGGDPWPVIADGRVYLAPYDAEEVFCLSLHDGHAAWPRAIRGRRQIAGVVNGSVVLVGGDRVEAVAADTGHQQWTRPMPPGLRPSGRGLLTPSRLFLPVDAPGVLELDLTDGRVLGRHGVRGGGVPGNLVAVRGEVISRSIDSLDVFHQSADLESRVETAAAGYWSGQLKLTEGDVTESLRLIRDTAKAARVPPSAVADALAFALRRDGAAAIAVWATWDREGESAARTDEVLRLVVDGSVRCRDDATAWKACRTLLARADRSSLPTPLIVDPLDESLEVDAGRWLEGRLEELVARAEPDRRQEMLTVAPFAGPTVPAPEAGAAEADPAAGEWPLGLVEVLRERRGRDRTGDAASSQMVSLPLVGVVDSAVPGIAVTYDMQQRRLHLTDAFGRRISEPLPLETGPAMPFQLPAAIEPSVVGRTLVVRTNTGITAYDIEGDAGENRLLWRIGTRAGTGRELLAIPPAASGRVARNGGVPLGRRITEADDAGERGTTTAPAARPVGVLMPGRRSLSLLDPSTGKPVWERRGLPRIVEWIADDKVACGCTADGRSSPVIAMGDGRFLHTIDLPGRRERIAARGRHIVAVVPGDEGPLAARVRLDCIDTMTRGVVPLGVFAGDARATMIQDGRLGVVDRDGSFTLIDLEAGRPLWTSRLPDAPAAIDELHVLPWRDRYLVFAGSVEVVSQDDAAPLSPLHDVLMTSDATSPLSGAIWAVGRSDGRRLWQVAATVRRQCLLLSQPSDLPVLAFCRQVRSTNGGGQEMRVLLLDKRTGHAVLDETRLPVPHRLFVGCDLVGHPADHTITLHAGAASEPTVTLAFGGAAMPPQPPFQSEGRPLLPGRMASSVGRLGGDEP